MHEEWDFPRVNQWIDYCNRHPTLQQMVQAYLGIKTDSGGLRITDDNFADVLKALPAMVRH